jgi:hypothetical protein
MKEMYSGATMGLPERDEDLFRQINIRTAQRRQMAEQAVLFDHFYSDHVEPEEDSRRGLLDLRKAAPWIAAVAMSVLALLLGRMM